jgi:mevalonate kinase
MLMNVMEMEFKKKNIEIYIGRTGSNQQRHIIDIEKTPIEKIYIEYKKIMEENKDLLNQLYLVYANNNYEMQNLLNIL